MRMTKSDARPSQIDCRIQMRSTSASILLFILLSSSAAVAIPGPRFTVAHYGTRDGLGSNDVYCLLQDRYGILWAGTGSGLSRYDGYQWQNFRDTIPQALAMNSGINCMLEDERSNLWVGHQQMGLQYFNRQTFRWKSFKGELPTALPAYSIYSIAHDSAGTTWFATGRGLFYLTKHAVRFSKLELSDNPGLIKKVLCDNHGSVWVLSNSTLHRIETGTHTARRIDIPLEKWIWVELPVSIELDGGDGIIISTNSHLSPFVARVRTNGSVLRVDLPAQSVKIPADQDHFIINSDGRRWRLRQRLATTADQVTVAQQDDCNTIGIGNGWWVYCIIPDQASGIWWMATSSGVHKIVASRDEIRAFPATELGENYVRAVCEAGGRILIATRTRILEMQKDGLFHPLKYVYHGNNTPVKKGRIGAASFNVISEDSLMIGTDFGVFLLNLHSLVLTDLNLKLNRSWSWFWVGQGMAHERNGCFWIGTQRFGIYCFKTRDEKPTHFLYNENDPNSLPSDHVPCIANDAKGGLWFGTTNGLALWNVQKKSFKRYVATGSPHSICGSSIWSIAHTPNGSMWVGCPGAGISQYREQTDDFVSYTRANGFPFETVCSIIPQGNDTLWVSTAHAVFRFIPSTGSLLALHYEDGLHDDNFAPKSACAASDGRLFFGGSAGFTMISNPGTIVHAVEPKVLLTSVMIGDSALARDIMKDTHLETTYDHNTLLFTFGIMDYRSPENNRIEYMLEGVDKSWQRDEGRGHISYSALHPGTYRLRLRGANGQGVSTKAELVAVIDIMPAWWQTWWFKFNSAFAFLALISGFVYQRRQQRLRFNRAIEKVRSRERRLFASDIHDGPLQDLYGLRFLLEGRNSISEEALSNVGQVTKKVRSDLTLLCSELRPLSPDNGLASAVRHLIAFYQRKSPAIAFETSIEIDEQRLGEEQREAIFFVARTGIVNVIKHAHASNVLIRLLDTAHGASLALRDDGVGFNVPEALAPKLHEHQFGLDLCREFAQACDGIFSIASTPGAGTTLSLNVRKRKWWETAAERIS
jgi:ligand-binding sensor domain-containing protein/signal transduction histidine kinase